MIGASRRSWAWARLAVALAVMLVAVLPHATLAASSGFVMNHAPAEPAAHGSDSGHAHHAQTQPHAAPAACHDPASQDPASTHGEGSPTMPACCILGCGLLAVAPDVRAATTVPTWLIRIATFAHDGAGRTTKPAERPPRPQTKLVRTT